MSKKKVKSKGNYLDDLIELGENQYNYDYNLKGNFHVDIKRMRMKKVFTLLLFLNGVFLLACTIGLFIFMKNDMDIIEMILVGLVIGGIGVLLLMASYSSFKKWHK